MPEWRYRGRTVTDEEIDFIRRLIAEYPTASRRRLSGETLRGLAMEAGQRPHPRDMVCRGLLLGCFDRAGQIELPAIRFPASPIPGPARAATGDAGSTGPRHSTTRSPTSARSRCSRLEKTADEPLFNSLMEQHHYLGYEQPVGEHLKYLVWADCPEGKPCPHRPHGMEFGPSKVIWAAATVI